MSETSYTPATSRGTPLASLGGALAVGACFIGLLVFIGACAGFGAALMLSPLPIILGAVGLVLTVVGGVTQKTARIEDTQILAAIFVSGGETLKGLSLALLIGIISGTYSSIFNPAPLLVVWRRLQPLR